MYAARAFFEVIFTGESCDLTCDETASPEVAALWLRYTLPPPLRPGCHEFLDEARRVCEALDREGLVQGEVVTGWVMYGVVLGWSSLAPAVVLLASRAAARATLSPAPTA
jgi:hypothetical protein